MEALKYQLLIPTERKLTIKVPAHVAPNQMAEVIVIVGGNSGARDAKIAMLKEAMRDPLFIQDLKEVSSAFAAIDSDNLPD